MPITHVINRVERGPLHSLLSHLENPSVPCEAPSRAMRLPNSAHTMNTHWWSLSVATRKKASIQPWAKPAPSIMR